MSCMSWFIEKNQDLSVKQFGLTVCCSSDQDKPICVPRPLWHQRGVLLGPLAQDVQHVQKALAQMNVQLT